MGVIELIISIVLIVVIGYFFDRKHRKIKKVAKTVTLVKIRPSYEDLLQTDEWRNKRASIIKRDHGKCRWCGCHDYLQVHHRYYCRWPNERMVDPWDYPDEALITLCRNCHKKAHEKKIKVYYRPYENGRI